MGIKSGKGLSGALGRMRDVNYQYVPLPYQEMMTGNLMRQASYDKSEATLDNISALYDENFIAKDSEILEGQENQLNAGIDEMIESAGGDLGKLTGKFTNLYRKTASDKTYRNAKAQQVNRTEFIKELKKAKLDPGMAQYYLNQADEAYPGADKGQYSGVNYSNLTEAKVSKMLAEVGKNTPSMSEQSNEYAYADLNGNPITPEQAQQLGAGKYKKVQATRTLGYKDANKVYKNLQNYIENNPTVLQFMSDKANSLGMDPAEYMGKYLVDTSNRLSGVSKNHLSKFSDLPNEGADVEDVNTIPSNVNMAVEDVQHPLSDTGYLDVPGGSVMDAKTSLDNDTDLSQDMKDYLSSIYDIAAQQVYPDEADMGSSYDDGSMFDVETRVSDAKNQIIQSALDDPNTNQGTKETINQYRDSEGNLDLVALEELRRGGSLQWDIDSREGDYARTQKVQTILDEAFQAENSIKEDMQDKNERFKARVSEFKTNSPEVDWDLVPIAESKKTTPAVTGLIATGAASVYTENGDLVDLKDTELRGIRITKVIRHPIVTGMGENDQQRVMKIEGLVGPLKKLKTFELRVPEQDFQNALGTDKTINLFKGTEIENYTPGILSHKLQMLRTGLAGSIGLSDENERIRQAVNSKFFNLEALNKGDLTSKLIKVKNGYEIEGRVNINGTEVNIGGKFENIVEADRYYAVLADKIYQYLTPEQ